MFNNPGSQAKMGRAMQILLISIFLSDSTKNVVLFLVLVRGKIFLYHLKAYLQGFILSHGSFQFCTPFMVKNHCKAFVRILNHKESEKLKSATAQNTAL